MSIDAPISVVITISKIEGTTKEGIQWWNTYTQDSANIKRIVFRDGLAYIPCRTTSEAESLKAYINQNVGLRSAAKAVYND